MNNAEDNTRKQSWIRPVSLYINPGLLARTKDYREWKDGKASNLSHFVEKALSYYLNELDLRSSVGGIRDE